MGEGRRLEASKLCRQEKARQPGATGTTPRLLSSSCPSVCGCGRTFCERERERVSGKLKNTLLHARNTILLSVWKQEVQEEEEGKGKATSRPMAWWVPHPSSLQHSKTFSHVLVCLCLPQLMAKVQEDEANTLTRPPLRQPLTPPHINRARGYCSRSKPTASASSGTTPTTSSSSQAWVP